MHEVPVGTAVQSQSSESSSFAPTTPSIEPVAKTPLVEEPTLFRDDEIGQSMTELIELRAKLKKAEEEFRDFSLDIETKLLTLRNTVHVKKIMYEHLRQQLTQTRQEWADAYDEHLELDKQKKGEVEGQLTKIENIRKQIDKIESTVRKSVRDLELEKRTD